MTRSITKAAAALALPGLLLAAQPALALPAAHGLVASKVLTGEGEAWNDHGRHWGWRGGDDDDHDRDHGYYGRRSYYGGGGYDGRSSWRGEDGRYYCRRSDGTVGLLIGGAAGGVIGHELAGRRGDRTVGTILGMAGGALIGRAVDRGGSRCR